MTPATIIRAAQSDGVELALSPAGTIKATGDGAAVNRWLAVIREHKAEIIEALAGALTSWGWMLHFADREPLEVYCNPDATHAEILERYPDALAAEPIPGRIGHQATPEQEAELRALVAAVGAAYDFTEAEHAEALAVALANPVDAITCFRAMAKEQPATTGNSDGTEKLT